MVSSSKPFVVAVGLLFFWHTKLTVIAFQFPNPFKRADVPVGIPAPLSLSAPAEAMKQELLSLISGTDNGKSATTEQQTAVLQLVRKLETTAPAPVTVLTTDADKIDGTWYLQYTSPSEIDDADEFPDAWKPVDAAEGDANIETRAFGGQGAVSAQGIKVETANRVVKQIIDAARARVKNEITLDWGKIIVGGSFRQSKSVPYRAIVSFDQADIFLGDVKISLGWLFAVIAATRGGIRENGWLETTFIDKDVRIGRGNKGTLFVLTRDASAVTP